MGERRARTTLVPMAVIGGAAAIVLLGIHAGRTASDDLRARRLEEETGRLRREIAAAAERLPAWLERGRTDRPDRRLPPSERIRVPYLPSQPVLAGESPFGRAETLEFVEGDLPAARAEYERLIDGGRLTDAIASARARRNRARLLRAEGRPADAERSLRRAASLLGDRGREALLVAYDLARLGDDTARASLVARIEQGEFAEAPPSERLLIHRRLGGDGEAVVGLIALRRWLDAGEDRSRLLAVAPGQVAFFADRYADGVVFDVARQDAVLAALLPGVASGAFGVVIEGGEPLPDPPFAPGRLGLAPPIRDAVATEARTRFARILVPALALAGVLGLGALGLGIDGRRRAASRRRRQAFLLSATHELKTPLANIRLYAETIGTHGREDPERLGEFAGVIDSEAARLEARVSEMLEVAAGRARLVARDASFDPAPVLAELVDAYRRHHPEASVETSVPEAGVLAIRGTAHLFRRMAEEWLDNAGKFGGPDRVRVTLRTAGDRVELIVEDGGPGIPAGERRRIFEPYVRLDRDVKGAAAGTGLGLALVRQCADACGARVRAEAAPGGGARFRATFPAGIRRG